MARLRPVVGLRRSNGEATVVGAVGRENDAGLGVEERRGGGGVRRERDWEAFTE